MEAFNPFVLSVYNSGQALLCVQGFLHVCMYSYVINYLGWSAKCNTTISNYSSYLLESIW